MKNKSKVFLLLCMMTTMLLVGCGSSKIEDVELDSNAVGEIVELSEWPQNRFVDTIIEPTCGKIDYAIDDSENGHYSIFFSEISMEESDKYIEKLKSIGYQSIDDRKEEVAIGMLLEKDDVALSISASDGILGIYISIEK